MRETCAKGRMALGENVSLQVSEAPRYPATSKFAWPQMSKVEMLID